MHIDSPKYSKNVSGNLATNGGILASSPDLALPNGQSPAACLLLLTSHITLYQ